MGESTLLPSYNLEQLLVLLYRLFTSEGNAEAFLRSLASAWDTYQVYASFLTLFFLAVFIYASLRKSQVEREHEEVLKARTDAWQNRGAVGMTPRWQALSERLESESQSDWKQAIIEADILLEEAVRNAGYEGEGLGERLRGVHVHQLPSINLAWEAHKIRNRIAHEPQVELSNQDARRTLGYYQQVLQDLGALQ